MLNNINNNNNSKFNLIDNIKHKNYKNLNKKRKYSIKHNYDDFKSNPELFGFYFDKNTNKYYSSKNQKTMQFSNYLFDFERNTKINNTNNNNNNNNLPTIKKYNSDKTNLYYKIFINKNYHNTNYNSILYNSFNINYNKAFSIKETYLSDDYNSNKSKFYILDYSKILNIKINNELKNYEYQYNYNDRNNSSLIKNYKNSLNLSEDINYNFFLCDKYLVYYDYSCNYINICDKDICNNQINSLLKIKSISKIKFNLRENKITHFNLKGNYFVLFDKNYNLFLINSCIVFNFKNLLTYFIFNNNKITVDNFENILNLKYNRNELDNYVIKINFKKNININLNNISCLYLKPKVLIIENELCYLYIYVLYYKSIIAFKLNSNTNTYKNIYMIKTVYQLLSKSFIKDKTNRFMYKKINIDPHYIDNNNNSFFICNISNSSIINDIKLINCNIIVIVATDVLGNIILYNSDLKVLITFNINKINNKFLKEYSIFKNLYINDLKLISSFSEHSNQYTYTTLICMLNNLIMIKFELLTNNRKLFCFSNFNILYKEDEIINSNILINYDINLDYFKTFNNNYIIYYKVKTNDNKFIYKFLLVDIFDINRAIKIYTQDIDNINNIYLQYVSDEILKLNKNFKINNCISNLDENNKNYLLINVLN